MASVNISVFDEEKAKKVLDMLKLRGCSVKKITVQETLEDFLHFAIEAECKDDDVDDVLKELDE